MLNPRSLIATAEARHFYISVGAVIGAMGLMAACSASTGNRSSPPPTGTGGGSALTGSGSAPAAGGALGGGGAAIASGGSELGGFFSVGTAGTQGADGPDASCNAEVHQGERRPLDMYFLVDQSGSMAQGNPSKWAAVSSSLSTFLSDPANAGTGAGIGYFPFVGSTSQSTCTMATNGMNGCICLLGICIDTSNILQAGGSCNVSDYSMPDVPIQQLPGVAPMIQTSLQSHGPGGGTPTYPALQGAYQIVTDWAKANPARRTVLVLATDGEPTGCDNNNAVPSIASDLVAPALAGNPSISTFVIGVGNDLQSLNALAMAGGTNQAFIVDTGGDVAKQFAMALDAIRGQAASCTFSVPNNGMVDPTKVNASYTPPTGSAMPIYNVEDQTKCAANQELWYYSPDKTQIILCPDMCNALTQNGGSVQVLLGCKTMVQVVK